MFETGSYALVADDEGADCRGAAELGLIEAQLACLYRRRAGAADAAAARKVAWQIRDAVAARQALLSSANAPPRA